MRYLWAFWTLHNSSVVGIRSDTVTLTITCWFFLNFCCSVAQSYPTLCNPMDCSTPGTPVPHHLLKFVQFHVHCFAGIKIVLAFYPLNYNKTSLAEICHLKEYERNPVLKLWSGLLGFWQVMLCFSQKSESRGIPVSLLQFPGVSQHRG